MAVVSESEYLWSKADKVPCASHLWELVVLIVLLLAACFLLEAGLTIVSLRGSILTDAPRKPAQYIIYILLSELIINYNDPIPNFTPSAAIDCV